MENAKNDGFCGSLELYLTLEGQYKIRCSHCEDEICFRDMRNYMQHFAENHEPQLCESSRSEKNPVNYSSNPAQIHTIVIRPRTDSYEIHCNICTENNEFHLMDNFVSHLLLCHHHLLERPTGAKATNDEVSPSNDSLNANELAVEKTQQLLEEPGNSIETKDFNQHFNTGILLRYARKSSSSSSSSSDVVILTEVNAPVDQTKNFFFNFTSPRKIDHNNIEHSPQTNVENHSIGNGNTGDASLNRSTEVAKEIKFESTELDGPCCSKTFLLPREVHSTACTADECPTPVTESINSTQYLQPNLPKRSRKRRSNINRQVTAKRQKSTKIGRSCTTCGKTFLYVYEYDSHMRNYHPFIECRICKVEFTNTEDLLQHLRVHIDESQCPVCAEYLNWYTQRHLKKHFKLLDIKGCDFFTTDEDTLNAFQTNLFCKPCNIIFNDATAYKRHSVNLHNNLEPFECTQCGEKFQSDLALENHKKICCLSD